MIMLLYVEINIVGLFVIALMYLKGKYSLKHQISQTSFNALLGVTAVLLVFDSLMWLIDKQQFESAREINVIVSTVFFALTSLLGLSWVSYCYSRINDKMMSVNGLILFSIPTAVNLVVSLMSPKTGWAFYVDQNNVYHRGSLYHVHVTVVLIYFIASIIMVFAGLKNKSPAKKREIKSLFWFLIPPIIGFVVQSIFYGVSLMLICCVCSLLIIFLNLQSNLITTDILTKTNNRMAFNYYINWKINNTSSNKILFLLAIDADDFKMINDKCGHAEGDLALVKIANVLKLLTLPNKDFLARIGGDEFAVIGNRLKADDVNDFIDEINYTVEKINDDEDLDYYLSLSIGKAIYDRNKMHGAEDFMRGADDDMYRVKREKKLIKKI